MSALRRRDCVRARATRTRRLNTRSLRASGVCRGTHQTLEMLLRQLLGAAAVYGAKVAASPRVASKKTIRGRPAGPAAAARRKVHRAQPTILRGAPARRSPTLSRRVRGAAAATTWIVREVDKNFSLGRTSRPPSGRRPKRPRGDAGEGAGFHCRSGHASYGADLNRTHAFFDPVERQRCRAAVFAGAESPRGAARWCRCEGNGTRAGPPPAAAAAMCVAEIKLVPTAIGSELARAGHGEAWPFVCASGVKNAPGGRSTRRLSDAAAPTGPSRRL